MRDIMQWRLYRKSWLAAEKKITSAVDATTYLQHKKHHIHKDDLFVWHKRQLNGREVIYWHAQCSLCGYRHSIRRTEVPPRLTENYKRAIGWDEANELRARHGDKASAAFDLTRINYQEYLNSDAWQAKRLEAFAAHGERCQICLAEKATQIHHLTYAHLGDEPMEDLMPLCQQCHKFLHDSGSSVVRGANGTFVSYGNFGEASKLFRLPVPVGFADWIFLKSRFPFLYST